MGRSLEHEVSKIESHRSCVCMLWVTNVDIKCNETSVEGCTVLVYRMVHMFIQTMYITSMHPERLMYIYKGDVILNL